MNPPSPPRPQTRPHGVRGAEALMEGEAFPALKPGEIHLWTCPLNPPNHEACGRWLSPDEKDRMNRFLFPELRRKYAVARGTLRQLAGRYLGRAPEELVFAYGTQGKPVLDGLNFNLSHSGERMAVAFAADSPVGLDIEKITPRRRVRHLAARYFQESERREMETPDDEEFLRRFFRLWTAKEAVMKATGLGFALELSRIEVGLFPLRLVKLDSEGETDWDLREIVPAEGFAGALVSRPGREVRWFSREGPSRFPEA
jgi:4'-phosphopantetheinyl transferase